MKGSRGLLLLFVLVTLGLYVWLGLGGGQTMPSGGGQVELVIGCAIVAAIITGGAALTRTDK